MPKTVIIGGSGHIGTFLVPRLVEAGHQVINVTRGKAAPYQTHAAWRQVEHVELDRTAAEADGTFGDHIARLNADIVVDLICFDLPSAQQLGKALVGKISHLIHIGTIWVHGHSVTTPTDESDPRLPFGDYGIKKAQIEDYLLSLSRGNLLPVTIVRPGHIVGPGWAPLNPQGHFNPQVFLDMKAGKQLILPNFGLETVHHVHADDIAQMVMLAIGNWSVSTGEAFSAVSPAALTLRGYAEAMFRWFGHKPDLAFAPFVEWVQTVGEEEAGATLDHISHSPCHSIAKAQRLLDYRPRFTSLQAVQQSVAALLA